MKRTPRPRPPKQLERQYFRDILAILQVAKALVTRQFDLQKVVNQAKAERQDDAASVIVSVFDTIRLLFARSFSDADLKRLADKNAAKIAKYNKDYLSGALTKVLGVDPLIREPYLTSMVTAFTRENVNLIKSISSTYFDQVESQVLSAVRQGTTTVDLAAEISGRYDVAESRANLIARDQVNKFNGQLNEVRQKSLGITSYVWRTVEDERVRPEHAEHDGQTYAWDDFAPDERPGQPVQCRCSAEPILDDLLDQ